MNRTIADKRKDESRDSLRNPVRPENSLGLATHTSSLGIDPQKIQGLRRPERITFDAGATSRLRGRLTLTPAPPSLEP
jgi:hypothetical protein